MTKKLEDLLNLPDAKEMIEEEQSKKAKDAIVDQEDTMRDIAEFDKIQAALPQVKGLGELADKELNEVSEKAMQAYEDLMDLGMNVEARFSGEIFNNASRMLDTALSAKQHKVNKKLRMVDLQIKKATLDAKLAKQAYERGDDVEDGQGHTIDRTQLLQEILGRNTHEKE